MEKDKVHFYDFSFSWIISQKLTKKIIHETIKAQLDKKS